MAAEIFSLRFVRRKSHLVVVLIKDVSDIFRN